MFGTFGGDNQDEKLSEIKPPLLEDSSPRDLCKNDFTLDSIVDANCEGSKEEMVGRTCIK